jgi:hypothetical protein
MTTETLTAPADAARENTSKEHAGKGFDRALLVGAGFAIAGAILTAILISSRDSREYSEAARAEAPAVPLGTG